MQRPIIHDAKSDHADSLHTSIYTFEEPLMSVKTGEAVCKFSLEAASPLKVVNARFVTKSEEEYVKDVSLKNVMAELKEKIKLIQQDLNELFATKVNEIQSQVTAESAKLVEAHKKELDKLKGTEEELTKKLVVLQRKLETFQGHKEQKRQPVVSPRARLPVSLFDRPRAMPDLKINVELPVLNDEEIFTDGCNCTYSLTPFTKPMTSIITGLTLDKTTVDTYIKEKGICPLTDAKTTPEDYIPNVTLNEVMQEHKRKVQSLHEKHARQLDEISIACREELILLVSRQRQELKKSGETNRGIAFNISSLEEQIKMQDKIQAEQVRECVKQLDLRAKEAEVDKFCRDVLLGNHEAVTNALGKGNVDLSAVDSQGRTALSIAFGKKDGGFMWKTLDAYRKEQVAAFMEAVKIADEAEVDKNQGSCLVM